MRENWALCNKAVAKIFSKYTRFLSTVKQLRIRPFQDDFQAFLVCFPLHTGIVRHGLCAVSMARWTGGWTWLRVAFAWKPCTVKKENSIFLIYKAIQSGAAEEGLPNIWGNAQIFPHVLYKEDVIRIWLCNCFILNLHMCEENLIFFFISVQAAASHPCSWPYSRWR